MDKFFLPSSSGLKALDLKNTKKYIFINFWRINSFLKTIKKLYVFFIVQPMPSAARMLTVIFIHRVKSNVTRINFTWHMFVLVEFIPFKQKTVVNF